MPTVYEYSFEHVQSILLRGLNIPFNPCHNELELLTLGSTHVLYWNEIDVTGLLVLANNGRTRLEKTEATYPMELEMSTWTLP